MEIERQMIQNIILIGATGSGKSSTGNMLLSDQVDQPFRVGEQEISCTFFVDEEINKSKKIRVFDTPGFGDNRMHERQVDQIIRELTIRLTNPAIESSGVVDAFLLPVKLTPRPQTLKTDLEHLMNLFGTASLKTVIILPIYSDGKIRSEQEILANFSPLKEIMKMLSVGKEEEPSINWFCQWDNLHPTPSQESNLFKKIATLEPYTFEKFLSATEEIKKKLGDQVTKEAERQISKARKEFAIDKKRLEQEIQEIQLRAEHQRTEMIASRDKIQNDTKLFMEAIAKIGQENRTMLVELFEEGAKKQNEVRNFFLEMNERNDQRMQDSFDSYQKQIIEMQNNIRMRSQKAIGIELEVLGVFSCRIS